MLGMDPLALAVHGGLDAVLQCQQRIIRRDQALAAGIAEPTLESPVSRGLWRRLLPRVYSVGADIADPAVRTRAGWLWAGEDSVVVGHSAAWWLGLEDRPPGIISIAVPVSRKMSAQRGYAMVRCDIHPDDRVEKDRITITSPARTCLDLARAGAEDRLETALRTRMLTEAGLQRSLDRGRGARGQRRARAAVVEVGHNPWSHPERSAHQLLTAAGVQGWTGNSPIPMPGGGTVFPDIRFDKLKLIVEIDGRRHHSSPEAFDRDHDRQNQLVNMGWTVLRITPRQLADNPDRVIGTVRATIARLESVAAKRLAE